MHTAENRRAAVTPMPRNDASTHDKLAWALNYAILAPSKHNTQPWYFEVTRDAVDIHADGARALTVSDPFGREMLISCGAALANLRLGIRAQGYEPDVHVFPQGAHFSHLARVRLGVARPVTPEEQRLVDAMPKRHTQRLPLDGRDLPPQLLDNLAEIARQEGAHLTFVTTRGAERRLAELVTVADRAEHWDGARRLELNDWVRGPNDRSPDGIPADSRGLGAAGAKQTYPTRDFDLEGTIEPCANPATDVPTAALLWTRRDEPAEWLVAGQALELVLLRASADDVHASFLNQPLEIRQLRARLAVELAVRGFPQMLLRLGKGAAAPATPRRPLDEVTVG